MNNYYALESTDLAVAEKELRDILLRNGKRNVEDRYIWHNEKKQKVCQIIYNKYAFWSLYIPDQEGKEGEEIHLFAYGTHENTGTQKNICQTNICPKFQKRSVGGVLAKGDNGQLHLLQRGLFNERVFGKRNIIDKFKPYWKKWGTINDQGKESLALYIGPLTDDLILSLSEFVRVVDEMRKKCASQISGG